MGGYACATRGRRGLSRSYGREPRGGCIRSFGPVRAPAPGDGGLGGICAADVVGGGSDSPDGDGTASGVSSRREGHAWARPPAVGSETRGRDAAARPVRAGWRVRGRLNPGTASGCTGTRGASGAWSGSQRAGRGSRSLTPAVRSRGPWRSGYSARGKARAMPASPTGPAGADVGNTPRSTGSARSRGSDSERASTHTHLAAWPKSRRTDHSTRGGVGSSSSTSAPSTNRGTTFVALRGGEARGRVRAPGSVLCYQRSSVRNAMAFVPGVPFAPS